ncbi:MAG: hypothetical protein ABI444_13605 [Candidatus Kapaibacterium sp.]
MTTLIFKEREQTANATNYDILNSEIIIGSAIKMNGMEDYQVKNAGNNETVMAPAFAACKLVFCINDDLCVVDSNGVAIN